VTGFSDKDYQNGAVWVTLNRYPLLPNSFPMPLSIDHGSVLITMSLQSSDKRVTITTLNKMKKKGVKIACLTAYDASFAQVLDNIGVEVILVGDSLGMVIQGFDTTIPVTMADIVYHTRCVSRMTRYAMIMADMPFMSCATPNQALVNAARLMQQGGAHMVKLEGGATQLETVKRLSEQGVPVCAHIGLQPQSIHKLGGYRVQGRDEHSATTMLEDAVALQQAGAVVLLVESIPGILAAEITANVDVPVIGIGAGVHCDGQILVLQDVLGITPGRAPRFTRSFIEEGKTIQEVIACYVKAVKELSFPAPEHTF
jgi:3-methyl-2-oxobutanoate hydroxymethyltransferase